MINPKDFRIEEFSDGSISLTCGKDGMETDLIFALGATSGDPVLIKQRKILEFIINSINAQIDK